MLISRTPAVSFLLSKLLCIAGWEVARPLITPYLQSFGSVTISRRSGTISISSSQRRTFLRSPPLHKSLHGLVMFSLGYQLPLVPPNGLNNNYWMVLLRLQFMGKIWVSLSWVVLLHVALGWNMVWPGGSRKSWLTCLGPSGYSWIPAFACHPRTLLWPL